MMQNEARPLADTALEPVEKGFDQAALLSVGGIVADLAHGLRRDGDRH